jgi:hypothetical protein
VTLGDTGLGALVGGLAGVVVSAAAVLAPHAKSADPAAWLRMPAQQAPSDDAAGRASRAPRRTLTRRRAPGRSWRTARNARTPGEVPRSDLHTAPRTPEEIIDYDDPGLSR